MNRLAKTLLAAGTLALTACPHVKPVPIPYSYTPSHALLMELSDSVDSYYARLESQLQEYRSESFEGRQIRERMESLERVGYLLQKKHMAGLLNSLLTYSIETTAQQFIETGRFADIKSASSRQVMMGQTKTWERLTDVLEVSTVHHSDNKQF